MHLEASSNCGREITKTGGKAAPSSIVEKAKERLFIVECMSGTCINASLSSRYKLRNEQLILVLEFTSIRLV